MRFLPRELQRNPDWHWLACRHLADFGAATADWLNDTLGYCPVFEVPMLSDEVLTKPESLGPLIGLNRAGVLVTFGARTPYFAEDRAGVIGYAPEHVVTPIKDIVAAAGLTTRTINRAPGRRPLGCAWACYPGMCACPFQPMPVDEMRRGYRVDGRKMDTGALENAQQVLIFDPERGRNDRLWPVLARIATEVR